MVVELPARADASSTTLIHVLSRLHPPYLIPAIAGSILCLGLALPACKHGQSPLERPASRIEGRKSNRANAPIRTQRIALPRLKRVTSMGRYTLRPITCLQLTSDDPTFGGLSGITVAPSGRTAIVVSDRGRFFRLSLYSDPHGELKRVQRESAGVPLRGRNRATLGPVASRDSESITRDSDSYVVSFEHQHRIWRYSLQLDFVAVLRAPPGLNDAPPNGGIEAITRMQDGRLLMLTEEHHRPSSDQLRGWLSGQSGDRASEPYQSIYFQPTTDGFAPTGLAALPTGDILVIERHFSLTKGFKCRIGSIPSSQIRPAQVLKPQLLFALVPPFPTDNCEGVSVRVAASDAASQVDVFVVSDNNFRKAQRTLLWQFRLSIGALQARPTIVH